MENLSVILAPITFIYESFTSIWFTHSHIESESPGSESLCTRFHTLVFQQAYYVILCMLIDTCVGLCVCGKE